MSIVVVATVLPVPEHRAAVVAAFQETIARVHGEDGCELYALHAGPDRLVMIEKWASEEALAVHGKSPALAELTGRLKGKIAGGLDVQVLRPHPAGKAELGAL
jgi:quinol monooxygenase YgiN